MTLVDQNAHEEAVHHPTSSTLFDRFVMVDWSASSTPKIGRDSIWSDVFDPSTGSHDTRNHRTRHEAYAYLKGILLDSAGSRVLAGFDFPFGHPQGFAGAAALHGGQPWAAAWEHLARNVVDLPDNANNRFEVAARLNRAISGGPGPFWGAGAPHNITHHLSRTKAPGFPHRYRSGELAEMRVTELALRRAGLQPFSAWQLFGAGSVGSQAMTGIPVLWSLRGRPQLARRSVVWPFETGLTTDPGGDLADPIVFAEVWPSSIPLDPSLHDVRDAAQVIGLAQHLADLDRLGDLASLFAPPLSPDLAEIVIDEEGWILGAPPTS